MNPRSRRDFVKMSACGVAGAVLGLPPLASSATAKDEPAAGTIIDTHVHFYDPTRPQGVPFPSKNDKVLYRPCLPEQFKALAPKVTGTVVVEASPWVEDNQWVLDLAKDEPLIVGLVGHLNPGEEDYRKHLDRFVKNPLFRGLRIYEPHLRKGLDQPRFIEDLQLLATHDLELDVLGSPALLPQTADLAKLIPNLRVLINHVANVPIDGKAVKPDWLAGMQAAAQQRNVWCKVSSLAEGTGRKGGAAPKEMQFYKPVLDALWETFGEDRLIYGSNWPVSNNFAAYATVQGIVSAYFEGKGQTATEKFFWRNSLAAYKWVKR